MSDQPAAPSPIASTTDDPARLVRIAGMLRGLLDEMRERPLDEESRERLRATRQRALKEICDAVEPPLQQELARLELPLADDSTTPSTEELRIAHAQLVGWLTGLFNGVQTSLQLQRLQPPPGLPTAQSEQQEQPPGFGHYL
jgi:hypothetical protein